MILMLVQVPINAATANDVAITATAWITPEFAVQMEDVTQESYVVVSTTVARLTALAVAMRARVKKEINVSILAMAASCAARINNAQHTFKMAQR